MTDAVLARVLDLWPAILGGVLLGAVFYGSLWWTVRHGLASKRPSMWFVCSMVLRTGAGLVAIYMIGDGQWDRLATCLLGFVMARPVILRLTRREAMPFDGSRN